MDEWQKLGVGSKPPPYILDGSALQALHPDGSEQHGVDGWAQDTNGWAHCLNPKCGHQWSEAERQQLEAGGVSCPVCQTYLSRDRVERMGQQGGSTKSGLSLKEVGDIGEAVVRSMGEIPGVGPVAPAGGPYNFPIDMIVTSQGDGVRYGCEVKSQSSTAKGFVWAGTPGDIKRTLLHCMQNGLKPGLIGVRLNFFNDKANVFFREGLSSTWIGNPKMRHVATVDFSHLNPFQTPEQKDALLQQGPVREDGTVDTNHPDYDFNADLDNMFGPAPAMPGAMASRLAWDEHKHPRDGEGKFVAKKAIHELDVKDPKGKELYTLKRCKHCGWVYGHDKDSTGRVECPTCGEDPERVLRVTRVVAGRDPVRDYMLANSWTYAGRTGQGHHFYTWTGPDGTQHQIMTGQTNNPAHVNMDLEMDKARKRMGKCMSGVCTHPQYVPEEVRPNALPGAPLIHAGQEVTFGQGRYWVMEIDGSLALIYDDTGKQDIVPVTELQAVASADDDKDPEFMFVAYNGKLIVEDWHHNLREIDLVDRLLHELGYTLSVQDDIDPADVVIGVMRGDKVRIDSATRPEANEMALDALRQWEKGAEDADGWQTLRESPDEWQTV